MKIIQDVLLGVGVGIVCFLLVIAFTLVIDYYSGD